MGDVMELFSSRGGTNLSAMLEGLAQSTQGQKLLEKLGIYGEDGDANKPKPKKKAATTAPKKEVEAKTTASVTPKNPKAGIRPSGDPKNSL